jgi:hypothetical protein
MTSAGGTTDLDRLDRLVKARRPLITIRTFEEDEALQLVRDASMSAKGRLAIWTVLSGVYDGILDQPNPIPDTTAPLAGLHHLAFNDNASIACLVDIAEHLGEPRVLRAFRDLVTEMRRRGGSVVMIDHSTSVPDVVRAHAVEFEIGLPSGDEIEQIIRRTVKSVHRGSPLEVDVRRDDFQAMVRNLRGLTRRQTEEVVRDVSLEDGRIDATDIDEIIRLKREMISAGGLLEFVKAPTSMAEIGGLDRLKSWLDTRKGALDDAEDTSERGGVPASDTPRGVLMLGVQGAGKSLCAKAIATAWQRPLLRMDVGALYDKYIGESERRLRDTLHQAEGVRRCRQPVERRRPEPTHVRHAADLDAGAPRAGVPGRDRQRHRGPAARVAAEGPIR